MIIPDLNLLLYATNPRESRHEPAHQWWSRTLSGHILERLLIDRGVAGQHTMDAHLAALAVEYRGTIYSTDSDFARYPTIEWVNPLEQQ